jgi:hypothetical protein
MATPAMAMAVPIPVCVEILFPEKDRHSYVPEWWNQITRLKGFRD